LTAFVLAFENSEAESQISDQCAVPPSFLERRDFHCDHHALHNSLDEYLETRPV
jgi:hypothetical protein